MRLTYREIEYLRGKINEDLEKIRGNGLEELPILAEGWEDAQEKLLKVKHKLENME